MKQPTVTLLVAVYNTAGFLRQCLDSLCQQTLRDIQVVCVDDGSTDDSWDVLQEYSHRDRRVEVYHLDQNAGQAKARNVALSHARGTYIGFVDSDDWLAPDCLAQAVAVFIHHPQTDSVLLHTLYYYSKSRMEEYPMAPFEVKSGREAFEDSLTWKIHGVYLVRAAIHMQYPYDESALAFSDDNTTRLHYLASREVRLCKGTYYYRQHSASVSHQVSARRFDYVRANESMKQQLHKLNVDDYILTIYENHRWLNLIDVYMFYYNNRKRLNNTDCSLGLQVMRQAWAGMESRRLYHHLRWKFGYMPCPWWWLFRLQEEVYFTLRKLFGR